MVLCFRVFLGMTPARRPHQTHTAHCHIPPLTPQAPESELRRLFDEYSKISSTAYRFKANEAPVNHVETIACEVQRDGAVNGEGLLFLQPCVLDVVLLLSLFYPPLYFFIPQLKAPYYPDENILDGDVLFFEFDFELITQLLQQLVFDKSMITLMSNSVGAAAATMADARRHYPPHAQRSPPIPCLV